MNGPSAPASRTPAWIEVCRLTPASRRKLFGTELIWTRRARAGPNLVGHEASAGPPFTARPGLAPSPCPSLKGGGPLFDHAVHPLKVPPDLMAVGVRQPMNGKPLPNPASST